MIQIDQILCPVDCSDISPHALDHAAAIAHWYQSRLTVLYVFVNRPAMGDLLVLGTHGRSEPVEEQEAVPEPAPVELPRTATPLPAVAAGALVSLLAGLGLGLLRRRAG